MPLLYFFRFVIIVLCSSCLGLSKEPDAAQWFCPKCRSAGEGQCSTAAATNVSLSNRTVKKPSSTSSNSGHRGHRQKHHHHHEKLSKRWFYRPLVYTCVHWLFSWSNLTNGCVFYVITLLQCLFSKKLSRCLIKTCFYMDAVANVWTRPPNSKGKILLGHSEAK